MDRKGSFGYHEEREGRKEERKKGRREVDREGCNFHGHGLWENGNLEMGYTFLLFLPLGNVTFPSPFLFVLGGMIFREN